MTCAELTAVGLPAAYVPLPIGNGEQRLNALPIVQRGGGLLVEDAELTADWIKTSLLPVLTNIDQVAGMSEAAAALGRKDADRWLAKAVIEIVAPEQASTGRRRARREHRCAPGDAAPRRRAGQPEAQPGSLFTPRSARQPVRPMGDHSRRPRQSDARTSQPGSQQSGGQSASGGGVTGTPGRPAGQEEARWAW